MLSTLEQLDIALYNARAACSAASFVDDLDVKAICVRKMREFVEEAEKLMGELNGDVVHSDGGPP